MAAQRAYTRTEPLRPVMTRGVPLAWAPLRWDSILAGWLIGLTFFAFLALLGVATGLTAIDSGAAATGASTPSVMDAGRNSMIWTGISSIIAYLLGGYFATRIPRVMSREHGAMNGMMVFLISVPFMLVMGALGATGIMSGLGNLAGGVFAGAAQLTTSGIPPAQVSGTVTPEQLARAAESARNTAWGGLILGLVYLGASTVGGFFGATPNDQVLERVEAE